MKFLFLGRLSYFLTRQLLVGKICNALKNDRQNQPLLIKMQQNQQNNQQQTTQQPENAKIIVRQLKVVEKARDPNYRLFLPDPKNLLNIHFSVRGPLDTEYEGGWYHGRFILPKEYPFKAPRVQLITPSGRFEVNTDLCFSFTNFHPETWSPAIGIGQIVIALQSLFIAYTERGLGMISNVDQQEVKRLVQQSKKFTCPECGICHASIVQQSEQQQEQSVCPEQNTQSPVTPSTQQQL